MSTVEYRIVPGDDGYRVGADGSFWTCLVRRYSGRGVHYERSGDWRRVEPLPPHGPAGYLRVSLRGKPVELHSLVLRTFRGPKPEGQQGRHLDGNALNCAVENLAWGTPLENAADRAIHGRDQIGETHWKAALTASQVLEIRHLAGTMSQAQLAAMFGVSQTCVWLIVNRKRWKHI